MTKACTPQETRETFGSAVLFAPQPSSRRFSPFTDVRVFSPCTRRCLVFNDLVVPLGRKLEVCLGSDPTCCDLVLVGKWISEQHAAIFYSEGCYFIENLDPNIGTFVNGRRIHDIVELHPGDEIGLKPYTILFASVDVMKTA